MDDADDIFGNRVTRHLIPISIILAIIAIPSAFFLWATSTPGESYPGEVPPPTDVQLPNRLEEHVRTLTANTRNLNDVPSMSQAISFISSELEGYGYSVDRQQVVVPADNLIVEISAADPDAPILIVGAHYDTFGQTPGADDNASGVAALLELARELQPLDGTAKCNLVFAFYANEEPPYFKTNAMGSLVHAISLEDSKQIIGMISLETIGYFSNAPGSQDYPFPLSLRYPDTGNFIAFVGDLSSRDFLHETIGEFRQHARIASVGGTAPSSVQGIDWSDHWSYSQQGIPAIMVTDTALFRNPNYHRVTDTPDTLDYQRLALVVEGLQNVIEARAAP